MRLKNISFYASGHLYKAVSQAGGGFDNPVFVDPSLQYGVKSGEVGKSDFPAGYRQRVSRAQRRPGAVAINDFGEDQSPNVLAVEPGRTLRPCRTGKPNQQQQSQSLPSQHFAPPVQVSLPVVSSATQRAKPYITRPRYCRRDAVNRRAPQRYLPAGAPASRSQPRASQTMIVSDGSPWRSDPIRESWSHPWNPALAGQRVA